MGIYFIIGVVLGSLFFLFFLYQAAKTFVTDSNELLTIAGKEWAPDGADYFVGAGLFPFLIGLTLLILWPVVLIVGVVAGCAFFARTSVRYHKHMKQLHNQDNNPNNWET